MSYLIPLYNRYPLRAVRGEGIYLFDEDGTRYIDGQSGTAVTNLGHGHPAVLAAMHAQVDALWHTSNAVRIPQLEVLVERLCKLSFGKRAFLANSGVEAWEACFKIARKYFKDRGQPERYRTLCLKGCFHGRTMAAISAAKRDYMVDGFAPLVDAFDQVEPGDLAALEAAITPQTAFIMLEPVLGEGGLLALSDDYLRGVRALCDKYDLLLFVDEIQCGMGRTGKLFAYEWAGIEPDLMSLAKGLGNGFPVGAYIVGEKCKDVLGYAQHGSTFAGNPLSCAAANAVLDVMTDDGFLDHVNAMGQRLGDGLLALTKAFPDKLNEGVRGRGLMRAVQCKDGYTAMDFAWACFDQKLITIPSLQNVLRIMPPLTIRAEEVDEILAMMHKAAEALKPTK